MSDCVFCKIINNEIPSYTLYEDERFKVIFDRYPAVLGHTLILVKNHCQGIFDLPDNDALAIMALAKKIAVAIKSALDCDGMNLMQNNGASAGQSVNHFHLHLIPRYERDSIDMKWETIDPSHEEFTELIHKIKL